MTAMKLFFFLLAITLIGCAQQEKSMPGLSQDQAWFNKMVQAYKDSTRKAPNDLQKDELRKNFLKNLHDKIVDSLHYQLKNFRVKIDDLTNSKIAGVRAFHAKFMDDERNTFWMEFDYDQNDDSTVLRNPAYILLKDIREGKDTVLSFFYMADLEIDDEYFKTLKLRVVPFPKDY